MDSLFTACDQHDFLTGTDWHSVDSWLVTKWGIEGSDCIEHSAASFQTEWSEYVTPT